LVTYLDAVARGNWTLLKLSENTCGISQASHHGIMQAFNLGSNAAVVIFAVKQGLISPKP
jgi:hypothetical protein